VDHTPVSHLAQLELLEGLLGMVVRVIQLTAVAAAGALLCLCASTLRWPRRRPVVHQEQHPNGNPVSSGGARRPMARLQS
jgi:hypothetical protein